ncbi:hypothetical protein [Streptomyces sp. NPDC085466]|uniref:hypothetical protein n=1 Tax=Streptomyces sp. NPDC085466 TaxID=3365725 RepID=UPI0037D82F86
MDSFSGKLPDIAVVRDRCRSLAMLDAILSPDWEGRYYSFDSRWGEGEEVASMRDGCGSDWFMVFTSTGVYARGFDRAVPNSPDLLNQVPDIFRAYVEEPSFTDYDGSPIVTICFWREVSDSAWRIAMTQEGGEDLFALLAEGTAEAYREWAEEYYEIELDLKVVQHIFSLHPITREVALSLNPEVDLALLAQDIAEIGYPE